MGRLGAEAPPLVATKMFSLSIGDHDKNQKCNVKSKANGVDDHDMDNFSVILIVCCVQGLWIHNAGIGHVET